MCKQVSRLSFCLIERLPARWAVALCSFVRFTVTGIARNFHPCSLTFVRRTFVQMRVPIHLYSHHTRPALLRQASIHIMYMR